MEIFFIGKKHDENAILAAAEVKKLFPQAIILFGQRGDEFPQEYLSWKGDYLFSYLSPWIIPKVLLENTLKAAINWHPGPPEYPGIGCTNFAVYNEEKLYGITCHYMLPKVDTGRIIEVRRFSVTGDDGVFSITQKCYSLILDSFYGVIEKIKTNLPLPMSDESWKRRPYTRKELDDLTEITMEMSIEEIERRIKATTFDRPWAFISVKGKKFYFKEE
jgi:methionyl-tRNA formyltransferase